MHTHTYSIHLHTHKILLNKILWQYKLDKLSNCAMLILWTLKDGKYSIFHTKCYHFYFNWRWSQYPFSFYSANNMTQPFSCFCVHERKTWIVCKLCGWPSQRSSKFTGKQPEKRLGTDVVLHRQSMKKKGLADTVWHNAWCTL